MARAETGPYEIAAREGRFEVCSGSGRTIVVCRDEGSAQQYAVLLNQAWALGYKAGYREGRGAG